MPVRQVRLVAVSDRDPLLVLEVGDPSGALLYTLTGLLAHAVVCLKLDDQVEALVELLCFVDQHGVLAVVTASHVEQRSLFHRTKLLVVSEQHDVNPAEREIRVEERTQAEVDVPQQDLCEHAFLVDNQEPNPLRPYQLERSHRVHVERTFPGVPDRQPQCGVCGLRVSELHGSGPRWSHNTRVLVKRGIVLQAMYDVRLATPRVATHMHQQLPRASVFVWRQRVGHRHLRESPHQFLVGVEITPWVDKRHGPRAHVSLTTVLLDEAHRIVDHVQTHRAVTFSHHATLLTPVGRVLQQLAYFGVGVTGQHISGGHPTRQQLVLDERAVNEAAKGRGIVFTRNLVTVRFDS